MIALHQHRLLPHCLLAFVALSLGAIRSQAQTPGATDWRAALHSFALAHLHHSAWGLAHAQRDYESTMALGREESIALDSDVVYAAAYLHDLAGSPPYDTSKMDHADHAAELAGPILHDAGFPMEKLARVQDVIRGHMYYREPAPSAEARLFHDADTLDFLGAIGIARMISITDARSSTSLPQEVATLRSSVDDLPKHLTSKAAQREAVKRVAQMRAFLDALSAQTDTLSAL